MSASSHNSLPRKLVTEETLFLSNGLAKLPGITRPPETKSESDFDKQIQQLFAISIESTSSLQEQLSTICKNREDVCDQVARYKLAGLTSIWKERIAWLRKEAEKKEKEEIKRQAEPKVFDMRQFERNLSLAMIYPLLESQAEKDTLLRISTSRILLRELLEVPPCSLPSSKTSSFNSLEELLMKWLNQVEILSEEEEQVIASCLVVLACARKSLEPLVSAIPILRRLRSKSLPIKLTLSKFSAVTESSRQPVVPLMSEHQGCFRIEDKPGSPPSRNGKHDTSRASLACNGKYLYSTDESGRGLWKIGTGCLDSVQSFEYCSVPSLESGFVALASDVLLHRPAAFDSDAAAKGVLANKLNPDTLECNGQLCLPRQVEKPDKFKTVHLVSDGSHLFWVRSFHVKPELQHMTKTAFILFVDRFSIDTKKELVFSKRIYLEKRDQSERSLATLFGSILGGIYKTDGVKKSDFPPIDPQSTSIGVPFRNLCSAPIWTCGTSLSIMLQPVGRSSAVGSGASKLSFAMTHSFSLSSGQFLERSDITDIGASGWSRGAKFTGMGIAYEPFTDSIWTCSNGIIDVYKNSSEKALSYMQDQLLLKPAAKISLANEDISVDQILEIFLRSIGVRSLCKIINSKSCQINNSNIIKILTEISDGFLKDGDVSSCLSSNSFLRVILNSKDIFVKKDEAQGIYKQVETLIGDSRFEKGYAVLAGIMLELIPVFAVTKDKQRDILSQLLSQKNKSPGHTMLQNALIKREMEELERLTNSTAVTHVLPDRELLEKLLQASCEDTTGCMESVKTEEEKSHLKKIMSNEPNVTVIVRYIEKITLKLLSAVLSEKKPDPALLKAHSQHSRVLLRHSHVIFKAFIQSAKHLQKRCTKDSDGLKLSLEVLERQAQGSILGTSLGTLVTSLMHDNLLDLEMVQEDVQHIVQLLVECRRANCARGMLLGDTEEADQDVDEVEGREQRKQDRYCAPWLNVKAVETSHPVKEGVSLRETVTLPGAATLYLHFDPRCSTQYDYDKVVVFQGKSDSSKKLFEFGGNTLGFGSKCVLGDGWPTETITVPGNTVTFSYETRSGREQGVPDRAIWGFKVSVTRSPKLPLTKSSLFEDLSSSLSTVVCEQLALLYKGKALQPEERECKSFLQSKLLQRCIWNPISKASTKCSQDDFEKEKIELPGTDIARIKLSQDTVGFLRTLAESNMPVIRESIRNVIKPELIEEGIVSAVIKHLQLKEAVENFKSIKPGSIEYNLLEDVISETYFKIHALIRRLQVLAELEHQWENERDDIRDKFISLEDAFFFHYQHHESKSKELSLLFFLKGIVCEDKTQVASAMLQLQEKMEMEIRVLPEENNKPLKNTTKIVQGVLDRIELLLKVSINTGLKSNPQGSMAKSLQNWPGERKKLTRMQSIEMERSLDDSILQIPKLKGKMDAVSPTKLQCSNEQNIPRATEQAILEELFEFIGSCPEEAIPASSFLKAAFFRQQRSRLRIQALALMKGLLQTCDAYGDNPILVSSVSKILREGSKIDELTCGNLVSKVKEAFSDTMTVLVEIITQDPLSYKTNICELCIIPYTQSEENCIVKSGLVRLLDKLCGMHNEECEEIELEQQPEGHKLAKMAWAAFKVLSNRCIEWEKDAETCSFKKSSGLAGQVSCLLTNHLIQASNASKNSLNTAALQEVLSLLTELSESRLGKDILSQPKCVSKLLSLLLEPSLSPRMILIIARLCHVALPLMPTDTCSQIWLSEWSQHGSSSHPSALIIDLLMSKLADFLVPTSIRAKEALSNGQQNENVESFSANYIPDRLSLFVHKTGTQTSQDLMQLVMEVNQDIRIFRTNGENVAKMNKMDKDLQKTNKAEILTEDATSVYAKAAKMAQNGFTVSVGRPRGQDTEMTEQRRLQIENICKNMNSYLSKNDPQRPFLSSQVANELSAELISLMQSLLKSTTAEVWTIVMYDKVTSVLAKIRGFIQKAELLFASDSHNLDSIVSEAREILSAFSLLGCFQETFKQGSEVLIDDQLPAVIRAINYEMDTAQVKVNEDMKCIPLERLRNVRHLDEESLMLFQPLVKDILPSVQDLLIPDADGVDHLSSALPASGEGGSLRLVATRLFSEVRKNACKILGLYLKEPNAACVFLQRSCHAVDMLKCLSKDCLPSDREVLHEKRNRNIRALYHDCEKQSAPTLPKEQAEKLHNTWNPSLSFPPVQSLLFTHEMTAMVYHDEPTLSNGLPRGNFVFAQSNFPTQTVQSYFETKIISLGDGSEDSTAPTLALGLSPLPTADRTRESNWIPPVGCVLLHNNGRLVHYNGTSLLQWRSYRCDNHFNPGDTIGVGWARSDEQGQRGSVYVTLNGQKLEHIIDSVSEGLYPVVHIQKKDVRIKTNFGQEKYMFGEANLPSFSGTINNSSEAMKTPTGFENLPFVSGDQPSPTSPKDFFVSAGHRRMNFTSSRNALKAKAMSQYDPKEILTYALPTVNRPNATSGQLTRPVSHLDEDSDDDDMSDIESWDSDDDLSLHENTNTLLVKAWENKVFPVIRRRFRNDTERRDGLEQIRGALSLGMADIARQTVEFLYEENGGIPTDLHLPTLEDIKKDMSKFTIDKIKKGDQVTIQDLSRAEVTQPPPFATISQLRTFGNRGEVLAVDKDMELVQVETYLKAEGVLVRYWYPITRLERPNESGRKDTQISIQSDHIHRELINSDFIMSRLYCRDAYIELLNHAKNETLTACATAAPNSAEMTMLTSSLLMLRDVDIENVQFLCNKAFAVNSITGMLTEKNIRIVKSEKAMDCSTGSLCSVFFEDTKELFSELDRIISTAANYSDNNGEEHLLELSNQMCQCLQLATDYFYTEELVINDVSTLKSTITLRDSAFTVVTPRMKPGADLEDLRIEIQVLEGVEIKKNGTSAPKDIIQYPLRGCLLTSEWEADQYPTVILAADTLKIAHGGGKDEKVILELSGIPQQFPMVLAYIERVLEAHNQAQAISSSVLVALMEYLGTFLAKHKCPPIVKQSLFEILTLLMKADEGVKKTPNLALMKLLNDELLSLHKKEETSRNKTFSAYHARLLELISVATKTWGIEELLEKPAGDERDEQESQKWLKDNLTVIKSLENIISTKQHKKMADPSRRFEISLGFPDRFLALSGISDCLEKEQLHDCVRKKINSLGGLFKGSLHSTTISRGTGEECTREKVVVMEVRWAKKMSDYKKELLKLKSDGGNTFKDLKIHKIGQKFKSDDDEVNMILEQILSDRILKNDGFTNVVTDVFQSCYFSNIGVGQFDMDVEGTIYLREDHVLLNHEDNLLEKFFSGIKTTQNAVSEGVKEVLSNYGTEVLSAAVNVDKSSDGVQNQSVSNPAIALEGFLKFCNDFGKQNVRQLLKGLSACNYDMNLVKTALTPDMINDWTLEQDVALVSLMNSLGRDSELSPLDMLPEEVYLSSDDHMKFEYESIKTTPEEMLRARVQILQELNAAVFDNLLPVVSMRRPKENLFASTLKGLTDLFLESSKVKHLETMLNCFAVQAENNAPPEIIIDPLESIGTKANAIQSTWFYQAMTQLSEVSSISMSVPVASGGDPIFPFKVTMSGEMVQGNSGSFRHFMYKICEELQSPVLSVLTPYMGVGSFKGYSFLSPGKCDFGLEEILKFFGQILGMALRAAIPLQLNLMPTFWKSILGEEFDEKAIERFDVITHSFIKDLEKEQTTGEFETFLEDNQYPKFVYPSLNGEEVELCPNGENTYLTYQNRLEFAKLLKELRLNEFASRDRMLHIRAGLATLIPVDLVTTLFTPKEFERAVCGSANISLPSLKRHTIYQAGITENDEHIQNFWLALEGFSQQQLQRFIKFSCNQERIPPVPANSVGTGGLVPPYPMKIAPADTIENEPDNQHVRVETCMFMIKLPVYSSLQVMREKLLFAINSAYDPLSG